MCYIYKNKVINNLKIINKYLFIATLGTIWRFKFNFINQNLFISFSIISINFNDLILSKNFLTNFKNNI